MSGAASEGPLGRLLKRAWGLSGLGAASLAWAAIFASAHRNPWFDVFRHALSDLGGPRAVDPWIYNTGYRIYNYGLMASGALASAYALYLAFASRGKVAIYASAFMFIAGAFLALIGVFPSGTRPHTFVSSLFFAQVWMALLASSIDFLARRLLPSGAALLTISILGPLGVLLVRWPSVALLEVYGIVLIDAYIVILTVNYWARLDKAATQL